MKRKDLAYNAFRNCRVSGKYADIPFSGIVTNRRWHTIDPNMVFVWIKLDMPIEVFGQIRDGVCLNYSSKDWQSESTYIDYIDPITYPNK